MKAVKTSVERANMNVNQVLESTLSSGKRSHPLLPSLRVRNGGVLEALLPKQNVETNDRLQIPPQDKVLNNTYIKLQRQIS